MRYFRYANTDKNLNNALKAQYKALDDDEKRIVRRQKRWRRFSMAVSVILFSVITTAGVYLLRSIPRPDSWFWQLITGIAKGGAGLIMAVGACVLTAHLTGPLWKKVESFHPPAMKREILSHACGHLRAYYGLREPYLVTKCFDATDPKFRNHDVCLFVVGRELRITTDLIRGFLHGERDLGCYAFRKEEISLTKRRRGNQLMLELKADQTVFMLGYRAKGFIENI